MKTVLITGSEGFIGRNLTAALREIDGLELRTFDEKDPPADLWRHLMEADFIYHLAGVNRPLNVEEFDSGNAGFTERIVDFLEKNNKKPIIVFSSSIQAELENPYGKSKRMAEEVLKGYSQRSGAGVLIYRLPNVFGKWSRPNYNSVVATFCHNISRGLDITISDPDRELRLVYIDDVVSAFVSLLSDRDVGKDVYYPSIHKVFTIKLGDLADKLYEIRDLRSKFMVPDFSDELTRNLYSTYLSFLAEDDFSKVPDMKEDNRGSLAEIVKSPSFGQIFVSTSHGGVIRGNHYHHSKVEKFCVLKGKAVIRFRRIFDDKVISYHVSGEKPEVVDIPPGYTHSIENLSNEEMIVLFWANQVFDPENPDTFYCEV